MVNDRESKRSARQSVDTSSRRSPNPKPNKERHSKASQSPERKSRRYYSGSSSRSRNSSRSPSRSSSRSTRRHKRRHRSSSESRSRSRSRSHRKRNRSRSRSYGRGSYGKVREFPTRGRRGFGGGYRGSFRGGGWRHSNYRRGGGGNGYNPYYNSHYHGRKRRSNSKSRSRSKSRSSTSSVERPVPKLSETNKNKPEDGESDDQLERLHNETKPGNNKVLGPADIKRNQKQNAENFIAMLESNQTKSKMVPIGSSRERPLDGNLTVTTGAAEATGVAGPPPLPSTTVPLSLTIHVEGDRFKHEVSSDTQRPSGFMNTFASLGEDSQENFKDSLVFDLEKDGWQVVDDAAVDRSLKDPTEETEFNIPTNKPVLTNGDSKHKKEIDVSKAEVGAFKKTPVEVERPVAKRPDADHHHSHHKHKSKSLKSKSSKKEDKKKKKKKRVKSASTSDTSSSESSSSSSDSDDYSDDSNASKTKPSKSKKRKRKSNKYSSSEDKEKLTLVVSKKKKSKKLKVAQDKVEEEAPKCGDVVMDSDSDERPRPKLKKKSKKRKHRGRKHRNTSSSSDESSSSEDDDDSDDEKNKKRLKRLKKKKSKAKKAKSRKYDSSSSDDEDEEDEDLQDDDDEESDASDSSDSDGKGKRRKRKSKKMKRKKEHKLKKSRKEKRKERKEKVKVKETKEMIVDKEPKEAVDREACEKEEQERAEREARERQQREMDEREKEKELLRQQERAVEIMKQERLEKERQEKEEQEKERQQAFEKSKEEKMQKSSPAPSTSAAVAEKLQEHDRKERKEGRRLRNDNLIRFTKTKPSIEFSINPFVYEEMKHTPEFKQIFNIDQEDDQSPFEHHVRPNSRMGKKDKIHHHIVSPEVDQIEQESVQAPSNTTNGYERVEKVSSDTKKEEEGGTRREPIIVKPKYQEKVEKSMTAQQLLERVKQKKEREKVEENSTESTTSQVDSKSALEAQFKKRISGELKAILGGSNQSLLGGVQQLPNAPGYGHNLNQDYTWYLHYYMSSYGLDAYSAAYYAQYAIVTSGHYQETDVSHWMHEQGYQNHQELIKIDDSDSNPNTPCADACNDKKPDEKELQSTSAEMTTTDPKAESVEEEKVFTTLSGSKVTSNKEEEQSVEDKILPLEQAIPDVPASATEMISDHSAMKTNEGEETEESSPSSSSPPPPPPELPRMTSFTTTSGITLPNGVKLPAGTKQIFVHPYHPSHPLARFYTEEEFNKLSATVEGEEPGTILS